MAVDSKTSASLILRLQDPADHAAWSQFAEIYEPLIARMATQMGMQPADVAESTQEVLMHLTSVVRQWQPREQTGSFRSWLRRVARNVMIRFLQTRDHRCMGTGDTGVHKQLAENSNRLGFESQLYDIEFRHQVFGWVVNKIEKDFQQPTWQAFWLTMVENRPIKEVANEIQVSVGAVYIARSRVMRRLQNEVKKLIDDDWESFSSFENSQVEKPNGQIRRSEP
ncbi:sigma-70 family RNA polymerase sigma factor [Vicingaceae bacterium]|nr:sigma-70 family RNA polymerase sigma factor [Vicingaceae bacterium]